MISKTALLLTIFASLAILNTNNAELECTRENEEYACGSACQTTCATLGQPCNITNVHCNDACFCIDGYARDENEKCIPIANCP